MGYAHNGSGRLAPHATIPIQPQQAGRAAERQVRWAAEFMLHKLVLISYVSFLAACAGTPSGSPPPSDFESETQCSRPGEGLVLEDGVVFMRPGAVACLELAPQESGLNIVGIAAAPGPSVAVFRSWTETSSPDVYVSIRNPFDQHLKYRAGMQLPGEEGFRATSSCPVMPGGASFEHWPHSIDALAFTGFILLEDSDGLVCN